MHLYEISGECGGILLRGDRIMRGTRSRSYLSECKWQLDRNYVCWRARRRRESVDQDEGEATRTLRTSQKVAMSPPGAIMKKVILGQPPRSRLILLALSQPIIQRKGKLVQKIDGWSSSVLHLSTYCISCVFIFHPSIHPSTHPKRSHS